MRYLVVDTNRADAEEIAKYLPSNYRVAGPYGVNKDCVLVVGDDNAGWTLDDYVIPRLGSGMIHSEEVFPAFAADHYQEAMRENAKLKVQLAKIQMELKSVRRIGTPGEIELREGE